eukprot:GHVS01061657.1.p1 GENE.GHVS01061657.1~~GHVS01061657.1.p1  ORF type:complete len:559 (-),score=75.59 GHVS01061657.1:336-2012(-)
MEIVRFVVQVALLCLQGSMFVYVCASLHWTLVYCECLGRVFEYHIKANKMKFHLIFQLFLILPFLMLAATADDYMPLGAGGFVYGQPCDPKFRTRVTVSENKPDIKVKQSDMTDQQKNGEYGYMATGFNHLLLEDSDFTVRLKEPLSEDETKFLLGSVTGIKFMINGVGDAATLKNLLKGLVDADVCFERDSDAGNMMKEKYEEWKAELNTQIGNVLVKEETDVEKTTGGWFFGFFKQVHKPMEWRVDCRAISPGIHENCKTKWTLSGNEEKICLPYGYDGAYIYVEVVSEPDWSVYKLTAVGDVGQSSMSDWRLKEGVLSLRLALSGHIKGHKNPTPREIFMKPANDDQSLRFAVDLMATLSDFTFIITPETAKKIHGRAQDNLMKKFLETRKKKSSYEQKKSFKSVKVQKAEVHAVLEGKKRKFYAAKALAAGTGAEADGVGFSGKLFGRVSDMINAQPLWTALNFVSKKVTSFRQGARPSTDTEAAATTSVQPAEAGTAAKADGAGTGAEADGVGFSGKLFGRVSDMINAQPLWTALNFVSKKSDIFSTRRTTFD